MLEPEPGKAPLWQDTRVSGLFSHDVDIAALCEDLLASLDIDELPAHEVADLEDRVWEREWLADFGPMRFGKRLWICPGDTTVDSEDAVIVHLDPGLAFGTGTHATTGMCLEWLDGAPLPGASVLDYGCGSGVLAIAALKLGCDSALATDIDPQAIRATLENAANNGVADRLVATQDAQGVSEQFDIVVANILAGPLIDLADRIAGHVKTGCLLALSGILSEQVDAVHTAYSPWIAFDEPAIREQGGQKWARLTGRRIES